jgi:uncharacterized Zn finger protein (UPF0148 family)
MTTCKICKFEYSGKRLCPVCNMMDYMEIIEKENK